MSPIGKINVQQLMHTVYITVLIAVIKVLETMITNHGLSLTIDDAKQVASIAVVTALGSLLAAFSTDEQGRPLGIGKKPQPPVGGSNA